MQIKTESRMHRAARLEVAGVRDERIAGICGFTTAGLHTMRQRPEYKQLVQDIMAGVITQYDEALALDINALRQEFAVGVPLAMRTLIDAVTQKKDLKSSLEAAKELLDRDPKRVFVKQTSQERRDPPSLDLSAHVVDSITKQADSVASALAPPKEAVN